MKLSGTFVYDAGPLIHLQEIGQINILEMLENNLSTEDVQSEIKLHLKTEDLSKVTRLIKNIKFSLTYEVEILSKIFLLGKGEQSAILLAKEMSSNFPDVFFVSDDAAARMASENLHIQSIGTIGLIIKAGTINHLDRKEVINILTRIPQTTSLHIRPNLLAEIIQKVKTNWDI